MKFFYALFFLITATSVHANCVINASIDDDELAYMIKNEGWELSDYNKICNELKRHNLGIHINQTGYISKYQSTVATTLKVYPREIQEKYQQLVTVEATRTSLLLNEEKTSAKLRDLKYKDANNLLSILLDDITIWNGTLSQIASLREIIKSK